MENLIVIEGKEKYQYKDLKSMIENFINKDYYNLSEEEKQKELEKKAFANTMMNGNIEIVKQENDIRYLDENKFVINDEITYILSMLKFNKIILLEKTEANILGRYINKQHIEDNYIIINKYAREIMRKYLTNN